MKTLSTYRVNPPTTSSGHSISITTTLFGTAEEIERLIQNCAETIGSVCKKGYSFAGFANKLDDCNNWEVCNG